MARHNSKQVAQWEAVGQGPLKPNELHGRKRIAYFQFQGNRDGISLVVAQNDDVRLCQIPAGARITGGKIKFGAFGASTTLDIGLRGLDNSGYIDNALTVADDPDALATNLDVSAAGVADMFEESAYFCYETEKELEVYALFEGANPSDSVELIGFIEYVVD